MTVVTWWTLWVEINVINIMFVLGGSRDILSRNMYNGLVAHTIAKHINTKTWQWWQHFMIYDQLVWTLSQGNTKLIMKKYARNWTNYEPRSMLTSSTYTSWRQQRLTPQQEWQAFNYDQTKKEVMNTKKRFKGKLIYGYLISPSTGQNWTFNSKSFLKINLTDQPKRILRPEDIPGLEVDYE